MNKTNMSQQKQRLVLIDGNAIVHRAYHALPPLTRKDGKMVNAVYGFASMLIKVLNDLKPTHMAVSFDVAGKTFRDDLYDKYKATRVKADQDLYDQIPFCYDVVKAFQIPIYVKEGFEADDAIGTIAMKALKHESMKAVEVIVVTGDKDLLQLVQDKKLEVYLLKKGLSEFDLYDEKKVIERFGFGPEMMVDFKALRGDSSDNIPGVKGIGEKTAVEIIQKIGGIDQAYEEIRNPKSEIRNLLKPAVMKKLEEGEKEARMSYALAKIETDVPGLGFSLSDAEMKPLDMEKIEQLFREFEFTSLLRRLPGADNRQQTTDNRKTQDANTKKQKKRTLIRVEQKTLNSVLDILKKEKVLGCREVLGGKDVMNDPLVGFVFTTLADAYYVELSKLQKKEREQVFALFQDKEKIIIGHDVKQFVKALWMQKQETHAQLFDLMIASYLVNPGRDHDLSSIVSRELQKEVPAGTDQQSMFGVDPSIVAAECEYFFDLYASFGEALKKQEVFGLFENIEMKLIPVLARMELRGIKVDCDYLGELSVFIRERIDEVIKQIWKEAGEEFNVASSVQLRDMLFVKMQLPTEGIKKGKTGYSTAASELEKLHGVHPIIELIEEHRELAKIQNTYADVLPTLVNKKTNRIHTSFNQAVAATGRLSSSDPNLQNIPIRTELGKKIRNAFIAEEGCSLISADYSQIELRVVASLAEDKNMLEIFNNGEDIHKATAAAINGVPIDKVTKEMRYAAKEVNFGVLYGMGAYGLASRTGIQQWQAKEFIEKYFEQFAGVKKYIDATLKLAKKEGYVETLFGRRRYIPELTSQNFQLRNAGERMAVNMPIQGTAADIMKMAMIAVDKDLAQYGDDVKLLLQVHDELVLEVKKGLETKVSDTVKDIMEKVVELRVPVLVDVHVGERWGEMK